VAHSVESLLVNRRTSESSRVRIRGMSHVRGQKLGVANTKAKCTGAQVRLPVWTRNCFVRAKKMTIKKKIAND
jgi:hypothetical protein